MREQLLQAARAVAQDPSDHNVTLLLCACFDLPFSEMPQEFLDLPVPWTSTVNSMGTQIKALTMDCQKSEVRR